ncbi:uncharacterized protein HD556DRAFT_1306981 [Suillus plorans]|uniref:Uncharacterized protein n=1 Tax=Suillus plorans TaxID=116603 RepID=A0A9P7DK43_9AGAM|nr:uncharacterized protein HD556DRAFT_1306981 [Suillus plorans]KAG1796819.1 hypothetical protein HD556DRAFT_1306981 [Suillus plorans]
MAIEKCLCITWVPPGKYAIRLARCHIKIRLPAWATPSDHRFPRLMKPLSGCWPSGNYNAAHFPFYIIEPANVAVLWASSLAVDLSSAIQERSTITRVVVYIPLDNYELLAAALGGPLNLMQVSSECQARLCPHLPVFHRNVLLPSSVEVYIDNGATGVHFHGGISPWGTIRTSPFHEHIYPPYHGPSGMPWEHTTTILGTGSSGFESVPRDLSSHAALRVHHPLLPPGLPSTVQPVFFPSVSSGSNVVAPLRHQPDSFGAGATTPEIHPADRRISHPVGYATPLAQGHQVEHPGSYGFESALDDMKGHAVLQVHQPSLSPEWPWSMQPISIPSASSSTAATPPFSAQPPFLGGGVALPQILSADYQVFDNSGYGIQSAHRRHIQQPGGPRAYMINGLLIDEEYLMDGNGGYINIHACGREGPPCGLWVKADKRSIMRHGQRWHGDARGGRENKKTTCPWSGCDSQMLANTIPQHILSAHFAVVWICTGTGCSKPFGCHDSFKAHSWKCGSLGAIVQYDASTRVIDTTNVSRHYD